MTRDHRFEFVQALLQHSDIIMTDEDFDADLALLDAETIAEIDALLFQEVMLGATMNRGDDVTVATIH